MSCIRCATFHLGRQTRTCPEEGQRGRCMSAVAVHRQRDCIFSGVDCHKVDCLTSRPPFRDAACLAIGLVDLPADRCFAMGRRVWCTQRERNILCPLASRGVRLGVDVEPRLVLLVESASVSVSTRNELCSVERHVTLHVQDSDCRDHPITRRTEHPVSPLKGVKGLNGLLQSGAKTRLAIHLRPQEL